MSIKGTRFEREAFASFPDDLLVQRFTKEGLETLDFYYRTILDPLFGF